MPRSDPFPRSDDLTALPLFGQALVAARMARRAALAMLEGPNLHAALAACDAIEAITRRGDGWRADLPEFAKADQLPRTRANQAALEAVRWAFDSAGAAQAASDFPIDATVAASAHRCFEAIRNDRRVSTLQLGTLIHADIDQIAFACAEVSIGTYAGLTNHVFGRLPPCHALTLVEPRRTPEELAR